MRPLLTIVVLWLVSAGCGAPKRAQTTPVPAASSTTQRPAPNKFEPVEHPGDDSNWVMSPSR
jgi:nitrous oxide reductase accessory protein NosL